MSSTASSPESPNSSTRPIRILVIDDHPLLCEGIAALLAGKADLELVGQASNGIEGVEQFRNIGPI
jgi:DNA-binding NarL/FixJ family response regulator